MQAGGACGYPKRQPLSDSESLSCGTSGWQKTMQPYQSLTASAGPDTALLAVATLVPAAQHGVSSIVHRMKAPATAEEGQPRAASQLPWHRWAVPQTYRASALHAPVSMRKLHIQPLGTGVV